MVLLFAIFSLGAVGCLTEVSPGRNEIIIEFISNVTLPVGGNIDGNPIDPNNDLLHLIKSIEEGHSKQVKDAQEILVEWRTTWSGAE